MKSFVSLTLVGMARSCVRGHRSTLSLPMLLLFFSATLCFAANPVLIGSKKFTESYVLGEIAKRTLNETGIPAEHRQGMGGTIILWEALRGGQIDVYPEYTGTIAQEILKTERQLSVQEIRDALTKFGVGMTEPLGFNNTYALVMRRNEAQRLGIRTIGDLGKHPELKIGLTHEFLDRRDGWQPLRQRYSLPQLNIVGIDHALGYAALAKGSIDVKDAYSTDAKIAENDLVALADSFDFFPNFFARRCDRCIAWSCRHARRSAHGSAERRSGAHKKLHKSCKLIFSERRWIGSYRRRILLAKACTLDVAPS